MNNTQDKAALKLIISLVGASLFYAGYWWLRYHHLPHLVDWLVALITWYAFYSVQGGYRRIVTALERQNTLLVQVCQHIEKQEQRDHVA